MSVTQTRPSARSRPWAWLIAAGVLIGGCGESPPADRLADEVEPTGFAEPAPTKAAPQEERLQLALGDLDAYERGQEAELTEVNQAGEEYRRAKDDQEQLLALARALPDATVEAGARAAGLSAERYAEVVDAVDEILQKRRATAMMAAFPTVDTIDMAPELRAQIRGGVEPLREQRARLAEEEDLAYAALAPEVAEVFRARAPRRAAPRLDSLSISVGAARMKLTQ